MSAAAARPRSSSAPAATTSRGAAARGSRSGCARAPPAHGDAARARTRGATIAAGGKRLRPLLVLLAAASRAAEAGDARSCAPPPRSSSSTARRSSTTTCSTARRCAAAGPTVCRAAGREHGDADRRPAVLARLRRAGRRTGDRATPVRVLLATRARRSPAGELLQRARRLGRDVTRRALPAALRAEDGAPVRGGCELGALSRGGPALALGAFGRAHRARLPDARRRARRLRARPSAPASTRGTDLLDGTVTLPLILARERDPRARARSTCARSPPEEAEALCDRIAATGALEDVARARRWRIVDEAKAALPRGLDEQRARGAGARRRRRRRALQLSARAR